MSEEPEAESIAAFHPRLELIDTLLAQSRHSEAEELAAQLLAGSTSPAQQAWAQLKLAEVDLGRLHRQPAIDRLRVVIDQANDDPAGAEPRNWARVRLAETLTHESDFVGADRTCDAILSDHAGGFANDRQATWALIWKARSRMFTNRLDPLAEAPDPARMAAALADDSGDPGLAYEAYCLSGEIYSRLSVEASRLVKAGDEAYAASPVAPIVEETLRAQNYAHEGRSGPLMVQAMEYYRAAMELARESSLGQEKEGAARLQYASRMRHLGMGDKAIATLRMGIRDPANMTQMEGTIGQTIASFLKPDEAEAWHLYLNDPLSRDDPTEPIVAAELGTRVPSPSLVVTGMWDRLFWQARFYEQQRRDEAALDVYLKSLPEAPHAWARAQTHFRIACTCARLYQAKARQGNAKGAESTRSTGKHSADSAAQDWLILLPTLPSKDAHGVIERAVNAYSYLGYRREGLLIAEQIADVVERDGLSSSTRVFAKYVLMHALGQNGRHADAAIVARSIVESASGDPGADLREIQRHALLYGAHHHAAAGDMLQAHAMLDHLEADTSSSPELRMRVEQFRETIIDMETASERKR